MTKPRRERFEYAPDQEESEVEGHEVRDLKFDLSDRESKE
jgi:hypothetical protein